MFTPGVCALIEVVHTIELPAGMCGMVAFTTQNVANTLVVKVRSSCSVVMSRMLSCDFW